MRVGLAHATGLVAVGFVGCGLTADFSNLQNGTRADAALPDADAPDAAPTFCETLPAPVKLCTDFDEGAPLVTGWNVADLTTGGAENVSTTAFSKPGSFFSAVYPISDQSSARLSQSLPTFSPHVHEDFELLLTPSAGTYELAVIHQVTQDGTTYGLFYREVDSALQLELKTLTDDGGSYDKYWPLGPPSSTWMHVVIDADISDSATFTVEQDGSVVLTETMAPTSTDSRMAMFVEVGVYSFQSGAAQANFDNVILDWQ